MQACGVCPTDLHHREGGINGDLQLLGHEGPRVVEAVGEGVTDVAPGDLVNLNWRPVIGRWSGREAPDRVPVVTPRTTPSCDGLPAHPHPRRLSRA